MIYTVGTLIIDTHRRRVSVAGCDIRLTNLEYGTLVMLVEANGKPVERETLATMLRLRTKMNGRSVDQIVYHIRRAIAASGERIETVYSIGYLMREADHVRSWRDAA